jgi:hypothetical protein
VIKHSVNARHLLLGLAAILTGAMVALVGCTHSAAPPERVAVTPASAFAGNASCVPCHASECASHRGSRHDTTMHAATRTALGTLSPRAGVVPLAGYTLEDRGDALAVVRQNFDTGKQEVLPLNLVFGSGKVGLTFVSVLSPDSMMETHMSYFPDYHLWDMTPGQEIKRAGDVPFGRLHTGESARHCLNCHTTTVPERTLLPEPRFYGVGCEACHGPGQAHIEAMQAKRYTEPHMENLAKRSPAQLNRLCGKCHRNVEDVDVRTPDANQTHRYQPYALARSACRTKSGEPLSCLSCHDAHTDVSTDIKKYEQECLNCHAQPGASHPISGDPNVWQAKVCPVNATTGCISCHMRPKRLFPETTITATLADHWISIEHK